jgi:hypothetical protein
MQVGIEAIGAEELCRKLDANVLLAGPLRNFLEKCVRSVYMAARTNVPRDTGALYNSLQYRVDSAHLPLWAETGTNLSYSVYVEFGTRPHFPPLAALAGWASRHGFGDNVYLVGLAIARHGTPAFHFLRDAVQSSEPEFSGYARAMESEVRQIWQT